jgi:hypothetical protein
MNFPGRVMRSSGDEMPSHKRTTDIHDSISMLRSETMVSDQKYKDWHFSSGTRWSSPDGRTRVFVFPALILHFREPQRPDGMKKIFMFEGSIVLNDQPINVCFTYWTEDIEQPMAVNFPKGLAEPGGLILNLCLYQINFGNIYRSSSDDISPSDLEYLSKFLSQLGTQWLEQIVSRARQDQEERGKFAIPVIGRFSEKWRSPGRPLVELHARGAAAREKAFASGGKISIGAKYLFKQENGRNIAIPAEEPNVRIILPVENRDERDPLQGKVHLGRTSVDVEMLALGTGSAKFGSFSEEIFINYYMAIDPNSQYFVSRDTESSNVSDAFANKAAALMLEAWISFRDSQASSKSISYGFAI